MPTVKLAHSGDRLPTQADRASTAEGEASLNDDSDDLDIVRSRSKADKQQVRFDKYVDQLGQEPVQISSDSDQGAKDVSKRRRKEETGGERIAFSDDEDSDAAYRTFKKRKSVTAKKAASIRKQARTKPSKNAVVGRKPRNAAVLDDKKTARYGDEDDDAALMEDSLPPYLQDRKASWEDRRAKLKLEGLMLPPDYDDIYFSDDNRLSSLAERPVLHKLKPPAAYKDVQLRFSAGILPAPIAQWLRDYQVRGAEFLHEAFVYQKGVILGDDMGLGKTIQVIAFLTAAFGKTGDERDAKRMRKVRRQEDGRWYPRVLIIAPGGLMANWKAELDRWGWWSVYVCHGSAREDSLAAAEKGRLEIMITTYSTYRKNSSAINMIRWDCVIADECHTIKEKTAHITREMNQINALCRIGLTGTAIQNKYEELWTLLNWTNPGRFGPLSNWRTAIAEPLKMGQSHDATVAQLSKARRTAEKLVKNLLPQFFLRRMKTLIADQLPKKSDKVVFCPLTEIQSQAYNNFCDSEMMRTVRESSMPCSCNSGRKQGWCCYTTVDGIKWQHFVFPALMALQKMSNHLALLVPASEADRERHDKDLAILKTALPEGWSKLYTQRDSILNYANQNFCGKWRVLKKMLKLWHENGDKVLVFSHSVRLLKMLYMLFQSTSYTVSYLDGSMAYEERQQVVDEYNASPKQFVFLISTKAGGMGLNITSANKVVVVDPNWNPMWDLQAQDRAYRIGQTRDVDVFRLISAGTVEEVVYARQIYKQQQANIGYTASVERRYFKGVQDQKNLKGEIFGLANLFAPQSDNVVLRDIVNKTNVAESRAGVEIAGLDMEAAQDAQDDDGDGDGSQLYDPDGKEDAAMSQLAADIIDEAGARRRKAKETAKKRDPVQAVLASVGVEYTHENPEVIGTSRIEMQISSRAQKAGGDGDWNLERAFAEESRAGGDYASVVDDAHDHAAVHGGDDSGEELDVARPKYRFKPAEDVRRRQFCSMARSFGYSDVSEFALVVEGWTQEQRRRCLDKWYKERREMLAV